VVEQIKCFSPQLQSEPFIQLEDARHAQVHVSHPPAREMN
jgi:hypothetical protein